MFITCIQYPFQVTYIFPSIHATCLSVLFYKYSSPLSIINVSFVFIQRPIFTIPSGTIFVLYPLVGIVLLVLLWLTPQHLYLIWWYNLPLTWCLWLPLLGWNIFFVGFSWFTVIITLFINLVWYSSFYFTCNISCLCFPPRVYLRFFLLQMVP